MQSEAPLVKSLRRAPGGGIVQPVTQTRFRGGQYIPADLWAEQKQQAKDALPALLERTGDRLQFHRQVYEQNSALIREGITKVKRVSLLSIQKQMEGVVAEAYDEAFLLGKKASGNLFAMTDADRKIVRAIREDEFKYLRGFMKDIRNEDGVMSYELRADFYKIAVRELWHMGFVVGNKTPGRYLKFTLGPTEHCKSCLFMAKFGWMAVKEFIALVARYGLLPASGKLDCKGYRCQCRVLEEFRKV